MSSVSLCSAGYEFREAPGLEKDANKKEMCFELIKPGATTYQVCIRQISISSSLDHFI